MSEFLTNFDQWYDAYAAAAPSQQYTLLQTAIAQPIPFKYAEEKNFGMILVDMWDMVVSHNLVNEAFALIATLQQQQPELYQQEFQYFADFLIRYHLFQHQIDLVRNTLAPFNNPIQGIDQLFKVLDDLRLFDIRELAVCDNLWPHESSQSRFWLWASRLVQY